MQSERFNDLFPIIPEEERGAAAENLDRYLLLAWEIYRELQSQDGELLT